MSLTSSSSFRNRNKHVGIWRRSINFLKGCSLCYCDAIYRRVFLFVFSLNHIPPYLFLSREDDSDVRDVGKHDFRSVVLLPMLSNANPSGNRTRDKKVMGQRKSLGYKLNFRALFLEYSIIPKFLTNTNLGSFFL